MIWVGEGEGGINNPCGFPALRAWHLSAVCGPLGACQTRHPWNHRATRKAVGVGWGQRECTNFVNCTVPSHTHPWAAVREQRRGRESRQFHVSEIAGPARWLTLLGLALSKTVQEESLFSLLSLPPFHHLLHSCPLPPPNTHTHTSHPATCPMTCPTLHLGAHLPAPQGSHHLSLILFPDLWLSISHQPPSSPQSVCPTLADLTSSSLTLTLVWTPPCIIMFRAQMCLPMRRQCSWSWRPCLILFAVYSEPSGAGTRQGASWTFRNVLSFLPVPAPLVRAATES